MSSGVSATPTTRRPTHREGSDSDRRDIVLICNPRAGGRWRELARIFDSDEARDVRRIVTDSIHDIEPALAGLGRSTGLVCIYGGDGTIHRIIDEMHRSGGLERPQWAFIGGGTMNVTAGWCGFGLSPAANFRAVVQAYKSGALLSKEVPLLEVEDGSALRLGFTFGVGPIIRVLDAYENGPKGKAEALRLLIKSVMASLSTFPKTLRPLTERMDAEIEIDGEKIPYSSYSAVFCNVTGRINIAVEPFIKTRSRNTFYCAAYAVSPRELALLLPFLVRGRLPVDLTTLLHPVATMRRLLLSYSGKGGSLPIDPRYVNETAHTFEIRSGEELYTLDGEIIRVRDAPIRLSLGPTIKVAVSPTVGLSPTMRLAAGVTRPLETGGGKPR